MHINPDAKTYPGQEAWIVHVSTMRGHKLFALKTCATGAIATAWDCDAPLRRYAAEKHLDLQNERS